MVSLHKFISFFSLLFLIRPVFLQQSYDESNCNAESGSNSKYLCTPKDFPCLTYIVYRAQNGFQSMSSISSLFNLNMSDLLQINHMSDAGSTNLKLKREIIIPVKCSCAGSFSQAIFMYNFSSTDSFGSVACEVFEGLLKAQRLKEENPDLQRKDLGNFLIKLPIICACPNANQSKDGVKYLVTYPVMENDNTDLIAQKFGVLEKLIWEANNFEPSPTIFPRTTLLVPTKEDPVLNLYVPDGDLPSTPRKVTPLVKIEPSKESKQMMLFIFLGLGLLAVIILLVVAIFAFRRIRRNNNPTSFHLLSPRSSVSSNVSPDFLDRLSKLKQSLTIFSLEELRDATEDFDEESIAGQAVYKGKIGDSYVAIEQMNTEEAACHVISILTKINHLNIVKLEGCCYGTYPYLVFEFAEYGSLRDCLSDAIIARQLTWAKRTRIAFDLAVGLHYIHYCTKPSFIHHNIHSRNVLITTDWRAKISGFTLANPVACNEENGTITRNVSRIVGRKGYLAPEYINHGLASIKVDVFAFGVVLLELLSSREAAATDGLYLKDSVDTFGDAGLECSSGYLEKLKEFMDTVLEEDYPLADAMCMIFLTKACVEHDPHHRPTMENVVKVLSRFV